MADWPRWIDDETVDSSAMFIAYIDWFRSECLSGREPELLPERRHLPYQVWVDSSGVDLPWIPCQTVACNRCRIGRGGYKFRWYSQKWQEVYMHHKRPGSWVGPSRLSANCRPSRLSANWAMPTMSRLSANWAISQVEEMQIQQQ